MSLSPVHHVTLSVRDLERSIAFYRDVLGLRLTMQAEVADREHEIYLRLPQGARGRAAILQADERTLGEVELIEWELPEPRPPSPPKRPGDPGVFLLAFEVTQETLVEVHERLLDHGVEFWSDIQTMGIEGYGEIHAVVFEDPDGVMIELLQLPSREEIRAARRAVRDTSGPAEG
jgi:catechol 2,3-dioxygenase-like lactoylglutathione lyase family enzyme